MGRLLIVVRIGRREASLWPTRIEIGRRQLEALKGEAGSHGAAD
jgi:hypothetical protein